MRKALRWSAGLLGLLLLIVLVAFAFIDEPLRAYAERQLNSHVDGYTFRIGSLDFHPVGLSVDLEQVRMIQKEHPAPPVAAIDKWRASIHWRELLSGRLVSDHVIERPTLHITRSQAKEEAKDDVPVKERGWQEAVLAVYPLKINQLTIVNGDLTYVDHPKAKPLHLSEVNFKAGNIRNIQSKDNEYPSDLHLDSRVFQEGRLTIDGFADFLKQPHLGLHADVGLEQVDLHDLIGLTGRYHIQIRQGVLSAKGHVEYAPRTQVVRLETLKMSNVRLDYIHAATPNKAGEKVAKKTAQVAEKAENHPTLLLRVDRGSIENSEFGFVNNAANPDYRVFIRNTDVYLENFSNRLTEGTAIVRLRGMFMGTGAAIVNGSFRPEITSPDFDLSVQVIKTQAKSMNDVLRAYGDFDVAAGVFSFYTEMKVKDGKVEGYMKPLFKNLDVYNPEQDRDKGLLKKIYEGVIGGVTSLLENAPRNEVATKADISGPVKSPQANTWEMVVKLIQNAFFEAILPGFEKGGR